MKKSLCVLIVEDSEDDTLLLVRKLQEYYELTYLRVDTADAFRHALQRRAWDVVLCDHSMPHFSSFAALQIAQQSGLNMPFIIVTGTMGEQLAVAAIKAGAHDCVLKSDLDRLASTVERELLGAQSRRISAKFEKRFSELCMIADQIADAIEITDRDGVIEYVNSAFERQTGYTADEVLGKTAAMLKSGQQDTDFYRGLWDTILAGKVFRDIFVNRKKNGELYYEEKTITPLKNIRGIITHFIGSGRDITERERSEQRFRVTFNQAAVGIAHVALDGRWLRVNPRLCKITGYSEEELQARNLQSISYPDGDLHQCMEFMQQLLIGEIKNFTREKRYVRKDGTPIWIELTMSLAYTPAGKPDYFIAVVEDIEVRKKAESQLRLFVRIFDSLSEGVTVTDANKKIVYVNPAFSAITGYTEAEVTGTNPRLLQSGLMSEMFYADMWANINRLGRWQGEIIDRRKNGDSYAAWLSISTMKNDRGATGHYIGIFSDISERKAAEERVAYMAHHDFLTGLPNRLLLQDRLKQAIADASREQGRVAVVFLDLDRFKTINDALGHITGDRLLQEVAKRILSIARASDTVCRQGGDEFVILLRDVANTDAIATIADKLRTAIARPYQIDEHEVETTTSMGISVFPEDGRDSDILIKHADAAMYQAKESGHNNYQFFTAEMNRRALERMSLRTKLSHALERREFLLYYQPQIDLRSGRLIGAEALLRWNQPTMGMIPPIQFIPIAEESGLIMEIGEWVLREACHQNQRWRDLGLPEITISVNLSPVQFRQKNLGKTIVAIVHDSGLEPSALAQEITESAVMHDANAAIEMLLQLKSMGLNLAVDDFGTGYSSLAYLKKFPIDKLKIDQSFVSGLSTDVDDEVIVSTIISMAHHLKLRVIAEGVETAEQLAFLRQQECDEVQGYYIGKPIPADQFTHLLASRHAGVQ